MKIFAIISVLSLAFAGCVNVTNPNNTDQTKGQQTAADYSLTAKVKVAITSDPSLSASSRMVSVSSNGGMVTLSGRVANRADMNRIINIAQNVDGVESVDNQMTIMGN